MHGYLMVWERKMEFRMYLYLKHTFQKNFSIYNKL